MNPCLRCGTPMPDGARFCPSCGIERTAPAGDERKVATLLFADLVGSTALAGSQDPERTRAMLDRFYDEMAAEVNTAGGTLEKFVGDAVMAAFGAPAAYEDHAERALHTAISMHRRLRSSFGDALRLRIGVNTGEVVVGRPREGSAFVTGDAVNIAARLEQSADPGDTLVGERTVSSAGAAFEFSEPIAITAKGVAGGLTARRLVRALSIARPRGVRGLRPAFVGREQELGRLSEAYRRVVARGRPALVTVFGDAGVGKTRLLQELWDRLGTERPAPVLLSGRCLAYGHGITYWALGEVLRQHLGVLDSDEPDVIRQRLGDREILGLTLGLDVGGDVHPLVARDRLHQAWIDLLEGIARERPVAVLVEDLHWAEAPLLDVLDQVARDAAGPILLLGTARPDFVDGRTTWSTGRYESEAIWVEPLGDRHSAELCESLLAAPLPQALRDLMLERAEGNPLFIEEMLGSLIDGGVLRRDGDEWTFGELPAGFAVPDTVQAIVAARIDLLDPADKDALQAAAVIGRTFWTGPVYELTRGHPDLGVLEGRDFVRRRPASSMHGQPEYAFKHAITRDVAYASVPRAKRAHLHASFAEWVERTMGIRDESAALLAHHYALAANRDDADLAWGSQPERLRELRAKAVERLRRAGDLATRRFEMDDAITLYRQALDLDPGRAEQAQLWRAIGRANAYRFDGMGLWDAMGRAIDLEDDRRLLGELYAELALETASRSGMWTRRPTADLVQGWIDRALELAEPDSVARAKALVALCFWDEERPEWAVAEAERLTERLGDPGLRIAANNARWLRLFAEGRFAEALEVAERAYELEPRLTDPETRSGLREASIALFVLGGRFEDARRLAREFATLAERLFPHQRLHAVAMALEVEEVAGDWETIRAWIPRTREAVAANLATPCLRNARSLLVSAAAAAAAGDDARSRALESEGEQLQMEGYGPDLDAPRIRLALLRGDLGRVGTLLKPPIVRRKQIWFYPAAVAAYLDGLAALGDRGRAENELPAFTDQGPLLGAFALRALARVREDAILLESAAVQFERLGLSHQAAATRTME